MNASTVHATLAKHYPAHVLSWVKRATWKHDPAVPLTRINMARRPGARNPEKVAAIAGAVKAGKPMPPVVLVDTGDGKLQIADGYHRTLGFLHAGKRAIPAVIASGVGPHGPWEKRMHAAKLNLTAAPARVVDLAGVCTGPGPCDTTPLGTGKNWLRKVNGLPDYIRAIAHSLRRDHGMDESRAIATAIATVKRWAAGGGNVSAETRARAAKAVAEWEAKKAASHALTATPARTVDLVAAPRPGQRYRHGWIPIDASAPAAVERATRAVVTDGHALLHGPGMVSAAHSVVERARTAGHSTRVRRIQVAGKTHLHVARTTRGPRARTPRATPSSHEPAGKPDAAGALSREDAAAFAGGSAAAHLVTAADGSVHFTPERAALHARIIDEMLGGHAAQKNPRYHLMGGGPASGKSTMMDAMAGETGDAAVINADEVKTRLPEYASHGATGAVFTHEESSYVAKRALAEGFRRRVHVTLDGTGDSSAVSLQKKIDQARAAGYSVHGYYVTIPTAVAVARAEKRAARTGRHVPRTVIEQTHANVSKVLPTTMQLFDTLHVYDNTDKLIEILRKDAGKNPMIVRRDLWAAFLAKARGI